MEGCMHLPDDALAQLFIEDSHQVWSLLSFHDSVESSLRSYRICSRHIFNNVYIGNPEDPLSPLEFRQDGLDPKVHSQMRFALAAIARIITDTCFAAQARPTLYEIYEVHQILSVFDEESKVRGCSSTT